MHGIKVESFEGVIRIRRHFYRLFSRIYALLDSFVQVL